MIGRLDGQTAIVTGAARGIGLAVADLLCSFGAKCYIADILFEAAEQAAQSLNAKGYSAKPLLIDVISQDSINTAMASVFEEDRRIDILVNNAGIIDNTPIPDMTIELWERVIQIDLRGTHLCSQAALIYMKQRKYGRIINMASQAGQLGGWKAGVDYSAAKGGVLALTKAYARHAAPYGINVNAVSPGFITTEMTAGRNDDAESVPLKRLGTALDVAKAVYFLSGDLSDYITGFTLDVNGGYFMH